MRRALVLLALIPLAGGFTSGREAQRSRILGPPETVFDWSNDKCENVDLPDTAASAFRDATGRVQLLASHYVWRRFVGPDLNHVTHDCRILTATVGSHSEDPSLFDDEAWFSGAYTTNGRDLYTLTHIEYHGQEHATQWCPSRSNGRCWYDAVGSAESHDGGDTWTHAPAPAHVVAAPPRKYIPDAGAFGYYSPTNIVRSARDRFYYYAIIHAVGSNLAPAQEGTCLIRTKTPERPDSWRAWDGKAFTFQFLNPYQTSFPADRACKGESVGWQLNHIVYSTYLHRWVATGMATPNGFEKGVLFMVTSKDLINWSTPITPLMEVELVNTFTCGDPNPIAYPSLIDPNSPSRTFQTIGHTAYLYYTRFNYQNCRMTFDRDLVRVAVEID
jgi:hypothetical protein